MIYKPAWLRAGKSSLLRQPLKYELFGKSTQSKILFRRKLLLVFVGLSLATAPLLYFTHHNSRTHISAPPTEKAAILPKEEQIGVGPPLRLRIPKIRVDAAIDPMGITKDGDMEAPSGAKEVGWFQLGPHPGDRGSAVLDGHYGRWKNGDRSVFDNLNKLEKGDELTVEDEKGAINVFVVREFRTFDKNADATSAFRSNDGKSHLNLITCEGVWSETQKTYSSRLVVFTDKKTG